jgi:Tol biopolymer transport system component
MREDGSNVVDLTPTMDAFDGDWSPDGSRIVFTAIHNQEDGIFVMDADGSNPISLGVAGGGPRWSPDGRRILFVSGGTIQVMNADGSQVATLTEGGAPDWSPDGTHIAFNRTDRSRCSVITCPVDIYVMAADGTQARKLISSSNSFDELRAPAWSPDGTKIAYTRRCCFLLSNESGLYVRGLTGTSSTRIDTHALSGRPVWSPDGSAIAFAAGQPDGTTQLTMIPSDGGPGVVLASGPGSAYPQSWK